MTCSTLPYVETEIVYTCIGVQRAISSSKRILSWRKILTLFSRLWPCLINTGFLYFCVSYCIVILIHPKILVRNLGLSELRQEASTSLKRSTIKSFLFYLDTTNLHEQRRQSVSLSFGCIPLKRLVTTHSWSDPIRLSKPHRVLRNICG